MVRVLPSLHQLPILDLNSGRIAANSFVIALHAAALLLLMAPVDWVPPAAVIESVTTITFVDPPKPLVEIPRPPEQHLPLQRVLPLQQAVRPPTATPANTEVVDDSGSELAVTGDQALVPIEIGPGAPALAHLTLISGPAPRYPTISMREGQQGLVLLMVLVDANGLPQDVQVERSSGFRELDLAALRQVRTRWRFQPALVNGQAAAAYALVPINFSLAQ